MIKNVFVTGAIQIGKSTLINKIINENNLNPSGYRTLPYFIGDNKRKGFYFHSLVDTAPYMNDVPISVQYNHKGCIGVYETFKVLGVHTLKESINDKSNIILMDELGKIERDVTEFKNEVFNVLNSQKMVVGVIKKCDEKWLSGIFNRDDTVVYDLDYIDFNTVYLNISNLFSNIRNK